MTDSLSSLESHPLRTLAAEIKQEWAGETCPPDARAAFERHPELLSDQSIYLDLAYEEYCQRRQGGEDVDAQEFCAHFPRHHLELLQLIDTHRYMAKADALLASQPLDFWPGIGEQVAGFTIRRELGRGTFARVYLATEAAAGNRPVALKMTFEGGAEACILGQLPHPNVVHVNSVGEDETTGLTRLCMPFLGSATLHNLVRRAFPSTGAVPPRNASLILEVVAAAVKPGDPPPHVGPGALTPAAVLQTGSYADGIAELGRQLADALSFVHQSGVFHRDLKPTNVLLGPGGRPVLLDFNLSKDRRYPAGRLGGTLPYMAPEQVRAMLDRSLVPAELDGRADQFSLGVLLYELLTGRLPFGLLPTDQLVATAGPALLALQSRGYEPIRKLNPAVHPLLARAVERCLALRPEERHADAAALASALLDYQTKTRPAPHRTSRRWAYAVGAAALLLITGLAAKQIVKPAANPPVQEAPKSAQELYDRGHAAMCAGDDGAAIALFHSSEAQRKVEGAPPDGRTLACLSYCLARTGVNENAVLYSKKAREAGFVRAAVFNNEGLACLRSEKSNPAEAYQAFTQAIACDQAMVEPLRNRAQLCLCARPTPARLQEARQDMDKALDLALACGAPRAELFYNAAQLSCLASNLDEALTYLQGAVACNAPQSFLRNDPILKAALSGRREFLPIINGAVEGRAFPQSPPLVDPTQGTTK